MLVGLAACGGAGNGPTAQPAPDATVFRGGSFDQLPRYPRSTELGPSSRSAGVVTQSFSVRNATPRAVVDYYRDNLEGWTMLKPVEAAGPDAFRGSWTKGDRLLQVSSGLAPAVDPNAPTDGPPTVQYNLQLGPPEAFP